MEHMDEAARHREAVALAELLKIFAGMFLMAAVGCLLLGGYGFDRDRKARNAMEKAVATVTEEYVHGGAYYVIFEADGETHEALMGYKKGTLNIGDQVAILYDPATYLDVRTDAPLAQPLYVLAAGGLCLALGGIGMFGQVYLRGRHANPWHGCSTASNTGASTRRLWRTSRNFPACPCTTASPTWTTPPRPWPTS